MVDKLVLQELTELVDRHELAIYLGPDLAEALSGVPGWRDLAARLAERGGFTASDWPEAAARYNQISGRRNLIDWLDGQINNRPAGPFYIALAKLPVSKYIATTYDELLQSSLQAAGREPNIVIEDGDLTSLKTHRPTVVKLFGEVSAGRREALLLTSGDLRELMQRRAAILAQEVQPTFTRTSLLILGQDLSAKFFRDLYHQYAEQAGPLVRRSFAVWPGLEAWEIDDWKTDEVAVLDANPIELIEALLNALEGIHPTSSSNTQSLQVKPQPIEPMKRLSPSKDAERAPYISNDSNTPISQQSPSTPIIVSQPTPVKLVELLPMLITFVAVFIILAVVLAGLAPSLSPSQLFLVVGGTIIAAVLIFTATFVAIRVFSPEAGERLMTAITQVVPQLGRLFESRQIKDVSATNSPSKENDNNQV